MEKVTKVTKREVFGKVIEILQGNVSIADLDNKDLYIEKLQNEIALLERKSETKKTGLSKTQKENLALAEIIVEEIAKFSTPKTAKQIIAESEKLNKYVTLEGNSLTTNKLHPILKNLVADKRVIRIDEKGQVLFTIA